MNDKEFRDNCKVLANDIVENTMGLRRSLKDPQSWCDSDSFGDLQAAALLYIASNMPSPNERAKKPCKFCSDDAVPDITMSHYFYIDGAKKMLVDVCKGEKTWIPIMYCPKCGSKL